jgi:hypothetical protein
MSETAKPNISAKVSSHTRHPPTVENSCIVLTSGQIWSNLVSCSCGAVRSSRTAAKALSIRVRLATSRIFSHICSSQPPLSWSQISRTPLAFLPHTNRTNTPTYDDAAGVRIARSHTRQRSGAVQYLSNSKSPERSRYLLAQHHRPGVLNSHFSIFFFFYRPVVFPSPATIFNFKRTAEPVSARSRQ